MCRPSRCRSACIRWCTGCGCRAPPGGRFFRLRSEEHTSELQSLRHLVCRLLLEKKKKNTISATTTTSPTLYPHARQSVCAATCPAYLLPEKTNRSLTSRHFRFLFFFFK